MDFAGVPAELRETVAMIKGVLDGGPTPLSADLKKTFGISSGMQPYDLAPYAIILQPVFSPIRNRTPRLPRKGKNFEFKGVIN